MSFDARWPRWIRASLCKYFDDNKGTNFLYVEGQQRRTNKLASWVELRIDGPDAFETSKDVWRLEIGLDILCSCDVDTDLYKIDKLAGFFGALMVESIPIYRYGDDNALAFCLTLTRGVMIQPYGIVDPKVPLLQSTVEADYYVVLP